MRIPTLAALLAGLLLSACASAPTHFYTLASQPAVHRPAGPALQPPIEVGDVPLPAVIDRNAIVTNAGSDRLNVSSLDQWGAPLGQLVRQTLTTDLQARLPQGSVLSPGATVPKGDLRILALHIQQFMGGIDGRVVLKTSWSLLKAGTSKVLAHGIETITVDAGAGTVAAIVPAMSEALGQLADRIAAQIS